MIKTSTFLAGLVVGAAATAAAQGAAPAPDAARSPRIAVIDMAKVSNDSLLA